MRSGGFAFASSSRLALWGFSELSLGTVFLSRKSHSAASRACRRWSRVVI